MRPADVPIAAVRSAAYSIPTDAPESDGTLAWDRTTLVTAEVDGGGATGFGYTYCTSAAAKLINSTLAPELHGRDAFGTEAARHAMLAIVRNLGVPGIAACSVSAVDIALWDLKGILLDAPVARLIGPARTDVPVYGSGGFTSYDDHRLADQLSTWASQGCAWVKMKVGREPGRDPERVSAARKAIAETALFVDANGAYGCKQALAIADAFAACGVTWFEEPVSSDDLEGLHLIRQRAPAGMDIAAGEYGYTPLYFRRMLQAGAVDVLQADATRCGGITGFLRAAAIAEAFGIPLSTHCGPSAHLHAAAAAPGLRHMEWFHDHVRIEQMLFDGAPHVKAGMIAPDLSRPGIGVRLKQSEARKFEVS